MLEKFRSFLNLLQLFLSSRELFFAFVKSGVQSQTFFVLTVLKIKINYDIKITFKY